MAEEGEGGVASVGGWRGPPGATSLSLSLSFSSPPFPPLLQFNPPSPPSPSASASSASASASAGDQEAPLRQLFHLSQSQLRFLLSIPLFCYEVPLPLCGGKTGIEEEEEEEDQEPVEEGDGPTSGNKRRIRHIQNKVTGGTKREENRPRTKSRKGRGKGNPLLVAPQFEKQTEECFFACQN